MFLELLLQRTEETLDFSLTPPHHLDLSAVEENSFNEEL